MAAGGRSAVGRRGGHRGHRTARRHKRYHEGIQHVLLISVDGLHQQDWPGTSRHHPHSALAASTARRGVQPRADPVPVRLLSRHGRPGDRRRPAAPASTTTALEPRPVPAPGRRTAPGRCRAPRPSTRSHRHELEFDRRGPGAGRAAGQHPADDRQPGRRDQPGQPAGRPGDVQAGLPEPVHPGQHHLQRGQGARAAHGLVGQAPGVPDVRRARRATASRTSSPRRSTARARLPGGRRLDQGQRRDQAVRLLQGPGDPERDRRVRPQPDEPRGRAGHLRDELPDGLHRPEAAHLRRPDRRLPARRHGARPAAERALDYINTKIGAMVVRDPGRGWPAAPRSSSRPSTASRRPTRPPWPVSPTGRSSAASTRPGPRRTPARARWSPSPPTTTGCCCG